MLDYKGRVADDGAEKFLFGDLLKIREAKFREEFLCTLNSALYVYTASRWAYFIMAQVSF